MCGTVGTVGKRPNRRSLCLVYKQRGWWRERWNGCRPASERLGARKGKSEGWMEIQHFVKNTKTRGYKSYIVCIFGELKGKENMKLE